jgi:hypothetical protein
LGGTPLKCRAIGYEIGGVPLTQETSLRRLTLAATQIENSRMVSRRLLAVSS